MGTPPRNPHSQREEAYQREPRYQEPLRGRRPDPPPRAEPSYQSYRQEPAYTQRPVRDDVLDEISGLQRTVAKLADSQPTKEEVLGAVRDLEGTFRQKLTEYYPSDVVDAKLEERAQILQTVRSELEEIRQKTLTSRVDNQALVHTFIRCFWNTWQARAILVSNIVLAGIFAGVVLIDIFTLIARK